MKRLTIVLFILTLGGCQPPPAPTVVVPVGPAQVKLDDTYKLRIDGLVKEVEVMRGVMVNAAGKVYGTGKGLESVAPSPGKDAAVAENNLAKEVLPPPTAEDQLSAEKRVNSIITGQLDEAKALYGQALDEGKALNNQISALTTSNTSLRGQIVNLSQLAVDERTAHAKDMQTALAAKDKEIAAAKDEVRKSFMNKLNYVLLGLGGLLILAAVANAWLTGGAGLGKSAILAAGGALCFGLDYVLNAAWFVYVAIGSVILAVIGVSIYLYLEWKDRQKAKAALVVNATSGKIVKQLDSTYEAATPEDKKVLDPIFAQLGNDMDAKEKSAVKLLRYEATTVQPSTPVVPAIVK